MSLFCFCFNDTATTEIYTLSLHDALPIYQCRAAPFQRSRLPPSKQGFVGIRVHEWNPSFLGENLQDRKSTRLNSSHANISYAVFCLKKKRHHDHNRNLVYSEQLQDA